MPREGFARPGMPTRPRGVTIASRGRVWDCCVGVSEKVRRDDAIRLARRHYLNLERVDMAVAGQRGLGIGRTTLYRWVGIATPLISEMLSEMVVEVIGTAIGEAEGEALNARSTRCADSC